MKTVKLKEEEPKFVITVPFTHRIIEADERKKSKQISIFVIIFGAIFLGSGIGFVFTDDKFVLFIVGGIGLAIIIGGIIGLVKKFVTTSDKRYEYKFYQDVFEANYVDIKKNRINKQCVAVYSKNKSYQYVSGIEFTDEVIKITCYLGTTNSTPNFQVYLIPTDVITDQGLLDYLNGVAALVNTK